MSENVHIICGPTASGKSARALALAQERNGVIINADSLQLYNRLPILTAQPDVQEQSLCPHLLYNLIDANTQMTAGDWQKLALQEIKTARDNNQTPIICGGTGFYIKVLTEGLSPIPDIPAEIREETERLMKEMGAEKFHENLKAKDAFMATKLHANDRQRNLRAWEVLTHTGQSLAVWQSLPKQAPDENLIFDIEIIVPKRDILYGRCDQRFKEMIKIGALDEVKNLDTDILSGLINADAPITHALGFAPLQQYVRGQIGLDEAIECGQMETRQYAKRQTTWFKNQIKLQKNVATAQFFTSY